MCRAASADTYATVLRDEPVRARKPHPCMECHRDIRPGETYRQLAWVFDGDFNTGRVCAHCQVARAWLLRECGGYLFWGVEEDVREHWTEVGVRTRELATLIWGMKRLWTRRDGSLMPVPALATAEQPA